MDNFSNSNQEYNSLVDQYSHQDLRDLNRMVFGHTLYLCSSDKELEDSIRYSKEKQVLVLSNESMSIEQDGPSTNVDVINCSSLKAAIPCKDKKVAVLNFANNHHMGGAPATANAQEEQICRKSTLFPCLKAMTKSFYIAHQIAYEKGELDNIGNDDLIYTPDVVVFKEDTSLPYMLEKEDWYKVDIITSAAPQCYYNQDIDMDIYRSRIKKILEVAKLNKVEVLILGAWGCGAFHNDSYKVAQAFKEMLALYHFEKVVFAIIDRVEGPNSNYSIFKKIILG